MKERDTEIIPGKDTKVVMDELYYTISGAMKKLNFGRNLILAHVNDGSLEVYRHGREFLFSTGALFACVRKHTTREKKKSSKATDN